MSDLIILGLAVGTAATTLTQSKIFRWLQNGTQRLHPLVGDLFNCPYCMCHWLAAEAVVLWFTHHGILGFVIYWLAVTGIAALVSGTIGLLFSKEHNNEH